MCLHILGLRKTINGKLTEKPASQGYKKGLMFIYAKFCYYNQIPYDQPKIRRPSAPIPIIPSTAGVNKIIGSASRNYAPIFRIMAETAIEGQELRNIHQNQIDKEHGILSVTGVKGHDNGIYPLKATTAEMLRQYLAKHPEPYPFPEPKGMGNAWVGSRKRASAKLCEPDLNKIPLKSLRNYAGAMFWYGKGNKDPWAVMKFMRHKKLSTTQDYLRGMTTPEEDEYTHRTIQLGTPTTIKEIEEAVDTGFKLATQADNYQVFVKLKPLTI